MREWRFLWYLSLFCVNSKFDVLTIPLEATLGIAFAFVSVSRPLVRDTRKPQCHSDDIWLSLDYKQEGTPVGCVLHACWLSGVCVQGRFVSMEVCTPPDPQTNPPGPRLCGQTDICENITLPQTSFAGGKYKIFTSMVTVKRKRRVIVLVNRII